MYKTPPLTNAEHEKFVADDLMPRNRRLGFLYLNEIGKSEQIGRLNGYEGRFPVLILDDEGGSVIDSLLLPWIEKNTSQDSGQ